ncbi:LCP family protein [Streptacidiphilus neutrinimicus]|uniref:LCP family protein n=1 Tax=Streptacidiphilus neutrinimicus TaxID=105420 RepID=UPI0009FD9FFD|nr:LCP family protein [Streptacidiphilus neutrinimicus]
MQDETDAPDELTERRPRSKARRVLKILALALSVLVLVVAGLGTWLYNRFSGNLHTVHLGGDTRKTLGQEKPDAFGRTPIDILVIGTDARNTQADCNLGGDCNIGGGFGNADVEMLVHVSANRSNATVMSIPRDTIVDVPACTDPTNSANRTGGYRGMVNSALAYGPQCQMETIHQLTGIPISHFMMVTFSGVVSMSDAVGGVKVCVSDNVYDTYSHLKLAKGTHNLKGNAALEFVRSRHAFGDGGDLGRLGAQHLYLSSMMRSMRSAGTLTDPTRLFDLADSATKALTVDSGLGNVTSLLGLANDVAKVPTNRMTFTTMQTETDPSDPNRLIVGPDAQALFATIANDQSLTSPGGGSASPSASASTSASPSNSASAAASVSPSASMSASASASASAPAGGSGSDSVAAGQIDVHVDNASGTRGRATQLADALTAKGFGSGTTAVTSPTTATTTQLQYAPGDEAAARTVAAALGLPDSALSASSAGSGVTLVIGADWPSGTVFPGASGKPAPASTQQALNGAGARTADDTGGCAQVSQEQTVELNGVPMSPIQAYAEAKNVPDSAP